MVGVLGGLAALRDLRRAGFQTRRSLELIVFTAEEPTRFGLGCLGSRLLGGALDPAAADRLTDRDDKTLADWRAEAGCTGDLAGVRLNPGHYSAFIELHIEQGPILEREGLDVGVVEKIAAPAALRLRLTGEGGHAGAVLMPERHDALLAGAEIALAVERAAKNRRQPGHRGARPAWFRVGPGAINSVPAWAELEIDLRDHGPTHPGGGAHGDRTGGRGSLRAPRGALPTGNDQRRSRPRSATPAWSRRSRHKWGMAATGVPGAVDW